MPLQGEELESRRATFFHPIGRYSDDILRLMFEECAESQIEASQEGFTAGICLSHVCHRWRELALSTPRIWRDVKFTTSLRAKVTEAKAKAFIIRAKSVPAHVAIDFVHDSNNILKTTHLARRIPFSIIYDVRVLSKLVLEIQINPELIFDAMKVFPKCELDHLQVIILSQLREPMHLSNFLSKFNPFRTFQLDDVKFGPSVSPNLQNVFRKLEEVYFWVVEELPIIELLVAMPHLKKLRLFGCSLLHGSDEAKEKCTLHHLRLLHAHCDKFPWSRLRCPSLEELKISELPGIGNPDGFWGFLSGCPIIEEISCRSCDCEELILLAALAPQLKHLSFERSDPTAFISVLLGWEDFQLSSPPLPALQNLEFTCPGDTLDVSILEDLIRRRCFFRGHPESMMEVGVKCALLVLEIIVYVEDQAWECGPYLAQYSVGADPGTSDMQIPSNPNLTRNRIPNERELGSLRELALQKKEAIDDLFEKAASARTKHEAVKNEYKSQLFILEEIESNLHLTKQNAESFEKAAETLGGEMLHLHGLLHPIRRSTDDNLRMIFESVVSGSGEPFLTASKLSHVCQRWRNVAISSPRLWSDLILKASFAYCTPNSKARTFLSRVKNAAATLAIRIHVNDAFTVQHLIRSIEQWPLFQLSLRSNISIWEIMVSSPSAENCSPLLHTITRFTSSTLDCLKLSILAPIDEPSNMFISKFPQFHKLELTCLHLGPTNPPCLIPGFSNLVEAVFHGIEDLSILGIIGTMPKLQTLRIQRCSVSTEPHLHDLVLFHLEILDFSPLNQQDYFPWRQIKCPKLTQLEFRVRDENLPADICSFVSVTTSITDMTIVYASPEDFLSLARIAPQLRRLCTWSDVEIAVLARWQQFGLNDPPFPNLLHLELRTWCYDSSFADVLDDIIRTRCLPRAHLTVATDGTVVHVLEAFSIIMWDTGEGASASYLALLAKHFSAYEEGGETIHRFVGEAGRESA